MGPCFQIESELQVLKVPTPRFKKKMIQLAILTFWHYGEHVQYIKLSCRKPCSSTDRVLNAPQSLSLRGFVSGMFLVEGGSTFRK